MARNTDLRKYLLLILLTGLALVSVSPSVESQLPTATISGVIKDASGAVIPGVAVTVTNSETGMTRNAQAASDGVYRFPALPVGTYDVKAATGLTDVPEPVAPRHRLAALDQHVPQVAENRRNVAAVVDHDDVAEARPLVGLALPHAAGE